MADSQIDHDYLFSRPAAAGYDRKLLGRTSLAIVGLGAGGPNAVLGAALSAVAQVRLVDPEQLDPSNFTRNPFAHPELLRGKMPLKAPLAAGGFLRASLAESPSVLYAAKKIEALGLGALRGCGAVISAVDNDRARAYLGDACRLLGIPLIAMGFFKGEGQVMVFPNRPGTEGPCVRCVVPTTLGGVSCLNYARAQAEAGFLPTVFTSAAAFAAISLEAALLAVHGDFPLGGRMAMLNLRTGDSTLTSLSEDARCLGLHWTAPEIADLDVGADASVRDLFSALAPLAAEPQVRLPYPFCEEAPCAECGAPLQLMRPTFDLHGVRPACRSCPPPGKAGRMGDFIEHHDLRADFPVPSIKLRRLGLGPGAVFVVTDAATGKRFAAALKGGAEDLFTLKRKPAGVHSPQAPAVGDDAAGEDAAPEGSVG